MKILQIINQMSKLKIPTQRLLECPDCGGLVTISASESHKGNNLINISIGCYDCKYAAEMCGHTKWKGWEELKI